MMFAVGQVEKMIDFSIRLIARRQALQII